MATDPELTKLLNQQAAAQSQQQFIRKVSLFIQKPDVNPSLGVSYKNPNTGNAFVPLATPASTTPKKFSQALDLSEMHFQFKTVNEDEEGPANCVVRIFNLKPDTTRKIITLNYSRLVLQAGYGAAFGIIFQGDIMQYRVGKLDQKTSYLDIMAADGDLAYNYAVANASLSKERNNKAGVYKAINDAVSQYGVTLAAGGDANDTGGIVEGMRGKVLWGLARDHITDLAESQGSTWSIQDGKIVITPLDGVLPGEAVVLTSATGLIGIPEQTQSGIIAKCLINPKVKIGTTVKIDNKSINQNLNQQNVPGTQFPFDKIAGVLNFASVATDGLYRVVICEHDGDTRGTSWYSTLTCLTIDGSTKNVKPYG